MQQKIIDSMLHKVQNSYDTAYGHISNVVSNANSQIFNNTDDLMNNLNVTIGEQLSQIANDITTSTIFTTIGEALDILNQIVSTGNQDRGESNDGVTYVDSIVIEPNKLSLVAGESATLKAKAYGKDGKTPTREDVKWASSNPKVATVSSSGKVTAKKFGSCTITATATDSNKKQGTCKVTVQSKTGSILDDIQGGSQNHGQSSASSYLHSQGYGDITREQRVQILKEYGYDDATVDNVTSIKYDTILKEKLMKKLATDWKNKLPKDNRSKEELAKLNQGAPTVYMAVKYGKKATPADMMRLAKILEYDYGGTPYDNWSGSMKTGLLNKFKSIGFSKGGTVTSVFRPVGTLEMLSNAVRANGDDGLIGAKIGEQVLTEEFMKNTIRPAMNIMNKYIDAYNSGSSAPVINISNVINVQGNADKAAIAEMNRITKNITAEVTKKLKVEMVKSGWK